MHAQRVRAILPLSPPSVSATTEVPSRDTVGLSWQSDVAAGSSFVLTGPPWENATACATGLRGLDGEAHRGVAYADTYPLAPMKRKRTWPPAHRPPMTLTSPTWNISGTARHPCWRVSSRRVGADRSLSWSNC